MKTTLFCLALAVAGCTTTPPPIHMVTITPMVPQTLLHCAPAPDVPLTGSQAVVARYIVSLWMAGQDCRAHVAAINQALAPASRN